MTSLEIQTYLPDVFTLAYSTWGLRLTDLLLLPLFFLTLTALFILCAPLSTIHGPAAAVALMRSMLCGGAALTCLGFAAEGLTRMGLLFTPLLPAAATVLTAGGVALLGCAFLFTVHRVYAAAC